MSIERKEKLAAEAANLVHSAYTAGWQAGVKRMEGCVLSEKTTPSSLLERFVDIYGEVPLSGAMIEPGLKLWRDYYEWTGNHMILTDEGWEPGEGKQAYIDNCGPNVIIDEVNAPR
jgi:hypothetical protein